MLGLNKHNMSLSQPIDYLNMRYEEIVLDRMADLLDLAIDSEEKMEHKL